jgi:hypothetical protein
MSNIIVQSDLRLFNAIPKVLFLDIEISLEKEAERKRKVNLAVRTDQ